MVRKSLYLTGLLVLLNCSTTKNPINIFDGRKESDVADSIAYINIHSIEEFTIDTTNGVSTDSVRDITKLNVISNDNNIDITKDSVSDIIRNYEDRFVDFKYKYQLITKMRE